MLDRVRYAPEVHARAFNAWRVAVSRGKKELSPADWTRVVGSVYEGATPHEVIAPDPVNRSPDNIPYPNQDLPKAAPVAVSTETATKTVGPTPHVGFTGTKK
jgi:hypothetical protein